MLTASRTGPNRAWDISPGAAEIPAGTAKTRVWRWPLVVALLALVVYSVAAVWMAESLHLQIGDSLARMADARAMLYSRDPHLAAIGLYWMPLPTIGQLPFMLVLSPLHLAELSGPLTDAFVGGLTVLVLARICQTLELSRALSAAFTVVYAFNPIVIYTAANGMSEAWTFLTCAVALLGFVRWSKYHRPADLAVLATGLAGVVLVRYEGLLLAPVIAVAAALNDGKGLPHAKGLSQFVAACRSRLRRWMTTGALVLIPSIYVFVLWMFMQYVLVRDPLSWYKQQKATGHTTPGTYTHLPAHTPLAILAYTARMNVLITPAIVVVGPLLFVLLRRRDQSGITGLGVLAGMLVWPFIVIVGLIANESAGAPRYFEPATIFIAVGAIWLAADLLPRFPSARRAIAGGLLAVLVFGAVGGAVALENPTRTSIESENHFFAMLLGHQVQVVPSTALDQAPIWRTLAANLDPQLAHGSKVLIDASIENPAFLFTRHPDHYIKDSDRDYERTLSDPVGKFDFVMRAVSHKAGGTDLGPRIAAIDTILANTVGGHWVKWESYYVADVYHWVPDAGSLTPGVGP